jgi:hypothetical protein
VFKILVGKLYEKKPNGRSGQRWEGNIRVDVRGSVSNTLPKI